VFRCSSLKCSVWLIISFIETNTNNSNFLRRNVFRLFNNKFWKSLTNHPDSKSCFWFQKKIFSDSAIDHFRILSPRIFGERGEEAGGLSHIFSVKNFFCYDKKWKIGRSKKYWVLWTSKNGSFQLNRNLWVRKM
jgi:hypothetical protein